MVKHTFVWDDAFESLNVKLGTLFEHIYAVWTTAKVDFLPADGHRHSRFDWFLSQTSRTNNQIACFLEESIGVCHEHFDTRGATKGMLLSTMLMHGRRVSGDSKSDHRAATRPADERVHVSTPFSYRMVGGLENDLSYRIIALMSASSLPSSRRQYARN